MLILLWLLPSVVVTLLAMAWVGWVGREGHGEVDRDEAVRALGRALAKEPRTAARPAPRPRERSTGVAVRARRPEPARAAPAPTPAPASAPASEPVPVQAEEPDREEHRPQRRAS